MRVRCPTPPSRFWPRAVVAAAVVVAGSQACKATPPTPSNGVGAPSTVASALPAELTAGERARLVTEIGRQFELHYVFPEVGTRLAAVLRERAEHGAYDSTDRAEDFARLVTDDLRAVSHDRHAMLEWTSPSATNDDDARWRILDAEHRRTAGFTRVERRPGNVAYVVLDSFEPADVARAAIAARMTEIADADALIIDLRSDSGGDPATVALVASYLFDATPVHLNDMWWRDDGTTDRFFTTPGVEGRRYGAAKPVFVLTSGGTFSAAEELAYDLQCLHRAQVVGEVTKGGAHPVARRPLSPVLTLRVPTGRAINPITMTNWEGTGVKPDLSCPAADAPRVAYVRALRAILASSAASGDKRGAQAALDALGPLPDGP